MKTGWLLAVGFLFVSANTARADIVYNFVAETIGPYTVTGTITTDGTIGTLSTSDIVAWDLTATDDSNPSISFNTATGFAFVAGSDLSATATQILFNFTGSDSSSFDTGTTSGDSWHVETESVDGSEYWGEDLVCDTCSTDEWENYSEQSNSAFVVAQTSSVPEPGSAFLLETALLALAIAKRERLRKPRA
jgi:hypothetical protein